MSTPAVKHNQSKKRFEIAFDDTNELAVLEYREVKPGVYDLYHTEVPQSKQGQGLGAKLADAAMEWVEVNKSKAILTCSYLRDYYLPRRPQFQKFIVSNL